MELRTVNGQLTLGSVWRLASWGMLIGFGIFMIPIFLILFIFIFITWMSYRRSGVAGLFWLLAATGRGGGGRSGGNFDNFGGGGGSFGGGGASGRW